MVFRPYDITFPGTVYMQAYTPDFFAQLISNLTTRLKGANSTFLNCSTYNVNSFFTKQCKFVYSAMQWILHTTDFFQQQSNNMVERCKNYFLFLIVLPIMFPVFLLDSASLFKVPYAIWHTRCLEGLIRNLTTRLRGANCFFSHTRLSPFQHKITGNFTAIFLQ